MASIANWDLDETFLGNSHRARMPQKGYKVHERLQNRTSGSQTNACAPRKPSEGRHSRYSNPGIPKHYYELLGIIMIVL